jgi:PIN domain nuclease of toxin-antitoxin system
VKILLDTCTFIWLITGEEPLPARARAALATNEVYLSAVCTWEIAIRFAKGQLRLIEPPDRLVPRARAHYGFASLPVDEESALHVVKLPPLHSDPFDRMLVSQAIVHGLTIVTPDPAITRYPARTIWS